MFFCGKTLTPTIIEETWFIIYEDVCVECIIYFDDKKYDYKNPDDFLNNNYNLDLKFIYEDYINEDIYWL